MTQPCSLLIKADYCLSHADKRLSLATWTTYLGWVEQAKRFAQKSQATDLTVADLIAFLATFHQHHPTTARNARNGIMAVYRHVLWQEMSQAFRRDFLRHFDAPTPKRRRSTRNPPTRLLAPIPSHDDLQVWIALLPIGKPQRACQKVFVTGIPAQQAARRFHTTIPAMKRVLRLGRRRAFQECGVTIPGGAGLRTLRTANILSRLRAGESPQAVCQAVHLAHLKSLTPYLQLAGLA